jgi:hypothetical protein
VKDRDENCDWMQNDDAMVIKEAVFRASLTPVIEEVIKSRNDVMILTLIFPAFIGQISVLF